MDLTVWLDQIVPMKDEIIQAALDTLLMMGISVVLSVLLGGALGIWIFAGGSGLAAKWRSLLKPMDYLINTVRAFPFVILILYISPLTKALIDTSIGPVAASFGLTVAGTFFFARLVEQNLREVPKGVIEAAVSMGASPWRIVKDVLLSESRAGMVSSITVLLITMLSYSATVGIIGGGGIGQLAVNYGYYRYQYGLMNFLVVILVIAVNLIQAGGNLLARSLDKR